jgi:hypothetical protein
MTIKVISFVLRCYAIASVVLILFAPDAVGPKLMQLIFGLIVCCAIILILE